VKTRVGDENRLGVVEGVFYTTGCPAIVELER